MSAEAQAIHTRLEQDIASARALAAVLEEIGHEERREAEPNRGVVIRALTNAMNGYLRCAALESRRLPKAKAEPREKPVPPPPPKKKLTKNEVARDQWGNPAVCYRIPSQQSARNEHPLVGFVFPFPESQMPAEYSVDFPPVWWGPGSGELNDWELARRDAIIAKQPIPPHPYELRGEPRPVHPYYNPIESDAVRPPKV